MIDRDLLVGCWRANSNNFSFLEECDYCIKVVKVKVSQGECICVVHVCVCNQKQHNEEKGNLKKKEKKEEREGGKGLLRKDTELN